MARSCGIRIGPRRFELVVLDGSPKRHKIVSYVLGELPRATGDEVADLNEAAAALRAAAKEANVPTDSVGAAIDAGMGAFRTLHLPFADKAKIEEVLKFEVENLLPHWSIDDVVVDFLVVEEASESSELLITAVQKRDVRRPLAVCEKAGVEPFEMELETTAMVNAAMQGGLCPIDAAQILVHVGEYSTSVVVVDGGKVREMRAIHIGALTWELATPLTVEEETAEGEKPVSVPVVETPADPAERQRRIDQALKRIRRELGRTVSAARVAHPLQSIYVCGWELPDLIGTSILDVPVRELECFDSESGAPAQGRGQLVAAYGAALRQMGGGVLHPSLRREELRYSGAFERIELPIAVVFLLLVTLLGVWNIFLYKDHQVADESLRFWRESAMNWLVGDLKKGQKGYLEYPSEKVVKYVKDMDQDTDRDRFEQLTVVRGMLLSEIKGLEKELGQDAEISYPQSSLTAATLVLDVLEKGGEAMGRPSLRMLRSTYRSGKVGGRPDSVDVSMDVSFFAENQADATGNYEAFRSALKQNPWCIEVEDRPTKALENGKGIAVASLTVQVDVSKAQITQLAAATPAK
ncbi:MAG: pilus assembly protein PilM [Planctomycetes bacterium]|nr:pilus assembly protein PilM [Planctomycetota bacterium]